jgi:hypothetical protein
MEVEIIDMVSGSAEDAKMAAMVVSPARMSQMHGALDGDLLMCPFHCDVCHSRNIQGWDPATDHCDIMWLSVPLRCVTIPEHSRVGPGNRASWDFYDMHSANLDALWSHALKKKPMISSLSSSFSSPSSLRIKHNVHGFL